MKIKSNLSNYFVLGISSVVLVISLYFVSKSALTANALPADGRNSREVFMSLLFWSGGAALIAGLAAMSSISCIENDNDT
jgi:hypothetical protein